MSSKGKYKQKLITLISGCEREEERGYSWFIGASILETGNFKSRGFIRTRDNKTNYDKYSKALHPEDRGWHLRIGEKNMSRKEICKRYNNTHKEDIKKRCKNYRLENPEWSKEQTHKRRGLGFIPLNEKFPNSEAHHIDKKHVIYIPQKLHHSVYHCIFSGKGMNIINMKAFGFALWKQLLSSDYDRVA